MSALIADAGVYLFKCEHTCHIQIGDDSYYCRECGRWIDEQEIGMVSVEVDSGEFRAYGHGYMEGEK